MHKPSHSYCKIHLKTKLWLSINTKQKLLQKKICRTLSNHIFFCKLQQDRPLQQWIYYNFKKQNMFDLSRDNYLLQSRPAEEISSQPSPLNALLNDQLYHYLSNPLLNQNQTQNYPKGGKWSLRQTMRYYLFLIQFKYLFTSKELRKSERIFSLMAKHIRSRRTSQCKSHHQKIQKNYGNIHDIIAFYKALLSPLKAQWKQFIKTEKRVLINEFPQINNMQDYYQIYEFKSHIKIYINESSIKSYQL